MPLPRRGLLAATVAAVCAIGLALGAWVWRTRPPAEPRVIAEPRKLEDARQDPQRSPLPPARPSDDEPDISAVLTKPSTSAEFKEAAFRLAADPRIEAFVQSITASTATRRASGSVTDRKGKPRPPDTK